MQNPFIRDINIPEYINDGGDINIVEPKTGKSWIEFLLELEDYRNTSQRKIHVESLLSNPELITKNLPIQNLLYSGFELINVFSKKDTLDIFINRFDLLTPINNEEKESLKKHNLPLPIYDKVQMRGLNQFLQDPSFSLFLIVKEFHPDFKEGLSFVTHHGNNVWHTFISTIAFRKMPLNSNKYTSLIWNVLANEFPEGVLNKNNMGETPKESLLNRTEHYLIHSNKTISDKADIEAIKNTSEYKEKKLYLDSIINQLDKVKSYLDLNESLSNRNNEKRGKI